MSKTYKAVITNFADDGKNMGSKTLAEDFHTLDAAIEAAEAQKHKTSDMAVVEIRACSDLIEDLLAWDDLVVGTGLTVYRDTKDIEKALTEIYEKMFDNDAFDGTMVQLLKWIKEGSSKSLCNMKDAVDFLYDDEINKILNNFSELIDINCEDGKLIQKEISIGTNMVYIYSEYPSIERMAKRQLRDMQTEVPMAFIGYRQQDQLSLAQSGEYVIIGLYGSQHSIRNRSACDFDCEIDTYATQLFKAFEQIRQTMRQHKLFFDVMNTIKSGTYKIRFNQSLMSPPSTPNVEKMKGYVFDIYSERRKNWSVYVSRFLWKIAFRYNKDTDWSYLHTSMRIILVAEQVILAAMYRDDKQFVKALKDAYPSWLKSETPELPSRLFGDKSRKDVMSGRYAEETSGYYADKERNNWKVVWCIENDAVPDHRTDDAWINSGNENLDMEELHRINTEYARRVLVEKFNNDIYAFLHANTKAFNCRIHEELEQYVTPTNQ